MTDLDPIDYDQITPGIRNMVRLLRDAGFDTSDSGDGVTNAQAGMECACPFPMVAGLLRPGEGIYNAVDKLRTLLTQQGFEPEPGQAQVTIDAADGSATFLVVGLDDRALAEARERKAQRQ